MIGSRFIAQPRGRLWRSTHTIIRGLVSWPQVSHPWRRTLRLRASNVAVALGFNSGTNSRDKHRFRGFLPERRKPWICLLRKARFGGLCSLLGRDWGARAGLGSAGRCPFQPARAVWSLRLWPVAMSCHSGLAGGQVSALESGDAAQDLGAGEHGLDYVHPPPGRSRLVGPTCRHGALRVDKGHSHRPPICELPRAAELTRCCGRATVRLTPCSAGTGGCSPRVSVSLWRLCREPGRGPRPGVVACATSGG